MNTNRILIFLLFWICWIFIKVYFWSTFTTTSILIINIFNISLGNASFITGVIHYQDSCILAWYCIQIFKQKHKSELFKRVKLLLLLLLLFLLLLVVLVSHYLNKNINCIYILHLYRYCFSIWIWTQKLKYHKINLIVVSNWYDPALLAYLEYIFKKLPSWHIN